MYSRRRILADTDFCGLGQTIETPGRISTSGEEIRPFDEALLIERLQHLKNLPDERKPEAITVSLINSFANPEHEVRAIRF